MSWRLCVRCHGVRASDVMSHNVKTAAAELAKETLHPHFPRQGSFVLGSGGCSVFDSEEPFLWSGQFLLYPLILLLLQNCPHRRVREDRR